jgi:hypothetical protein
LALTLRTTAPAIFLDAGIYPDYPAPIVRNRDAGRELTMALGHAFVSEADGRHQEACRQASGEGQVR